MKNFSQVLYRSCQEAPDRPAIHLLFSQQADQSLTYAALLHGAAGYQRALSQAGVRPGEVVILILNHGQDLVFAFFGAILNGSIPSIMPFLTEKLSPEHYRASLAALFHITTPAAVITYPEFEAEVRQAASGSALRVVLVSSQVQPAASYNFDSMPGGSRDPQEIALLQHSSGTTGLQKGVALSHRAVFNQLESYGRALHLAPDDVVVSWLPLYHDMGLIAGFLQPVLSRLPLVLLSPFEWVRAPARLFQAVTKYHGTLTWLPNFAYNFCAQKIRSGDLTGVDLSSWRAVINCSEPMHWQSHQMFLERFQPYGLHSEALATCYAMAENVFAVTQGGIDAPVTVDWIHPPDLFTRQVAAPVEPGPEALPILSAGAPIDNTQVRVLDASGQELPERQLGEIAIRSDCMLSEYYRRPDLTEKAFLDGWYLTGDLGYLAGGEVYVTGRKKDLIIVGGKNIYPQDLERLAGEVTGVHPGRIVAFGVFNEHSGTEEVVIVAEAEGLDPTNPTDEAACFALGDAIRQQVNRGSDVALRYVHIVERNWLLKTSSGKIARAANRDKYLDETGGEKT